MVWKLFFFSIWQAKSSLFIIFIDIRTIEWSYFSYIITISLKKIRMILVVACRRRSSRAPAAEGLTKKQQLCCQTNLS